jgi:translation initiation factor IF-1
MLKDNPENLPELELDEMESVTGGAGSNDGITVSDGTVVACLPNAMFSVDIGGQTVTAHISGKLRMHYVHIQPGDRVRVEVRDERGRITDRCR